MHVYIFAHDSYKFTELERCIELVSKHDETFCTIKQTVTDKIMSTYLEMSDNFGQNLCHKKDFLYIMVYDQAKAKY